MKRIISVILTIAMFLGISIETFAAYGGEKPVLIRAITAR